MNGLFSLLEVFMSVNEARFCKAIVQPAGKQGGKAALLNAAAWPSNASIRVAFLGGDPGLQAKVRNVARRWTAPGLANLTLDFVPDPKAAQIRIAFRQGDGSWSYIGTECLGIPHPQPTMNFGWLTPESSDLDIQEVVLHEFGHALGLIHEHQNPDQPIQWNRPAVIKDLSGPPNNWDEGTIETNMFQKYDPAAVTTTALDPASIMMYPIPASWTTDGFSSGFNTDLSPQDRALIRQCYP
jgi:serralysin